MLSRAPFRRALELRLFSPLNAITSSPTFAANRACLHQASSATQFKATQPEIPPQTQPLENDKAQNLSSSSSSPTDFQAQQPPAPFPQPISMATPTPKPAEPPTFTDPLKITRSMTELLPHLTSQSSHYITAHLHARPYLITEGDTIRLPFRMPNVESGDIIRLNRASNVGSRDFTLKGTPYLDERLFECRVRVMGTEAEPLRILEKTKRRQRHVKKVKSKHKYTVLRVAEVKIKGVQELLSEGAEIVEG